MIREATADDAAAMAALFHDTVRRVNCRDYTPAQIAAWSGPAPDEHKWRARQADRTTFVEEHNGLLRGFAELGPRGHIDAFYVHAEFQRQGLATALLRRIEQTAIARELSILFTDASITARPFFEKHGFEVLAAQEVAYAGEHFRNFRMEKSLTARAVPSARAAS